MGWLHEYQDVSRCASPRSVERGTRVRNKAPARFGYFNQAPGIPSLLQQSTGCLPDSIRSPRPTSASSFQSPASRTSQLGGDPSTQPEAGASSSVTASLANHDCLRSPRGPCRMSPHVMDAFCASPRRQLNRGASCPPARTDPITHSGPPRIESLSLRLLEFGHLACRERSLRKCNYTSPAATGKFDLKTHEQTSTEFHQRARTVSSAVGLNSNALAGEEYILPASIRPRASDKEVSSRYTKVSDMHEMTFIDRATIGGRKACNPSLLTSTEFFDCFGQPGRIDSAPPTTEQPELAIPASPRRVRTTPARTETVTPVTPAASTGLQRQRVCTEAVAPSAGSAGDNAGNSAQQQRPSGTSSVSDRSGRFIPQLMLFQDPLRP